MGRPTATVARHMDFPTGGCRRVYKLSRDAQRLIASMLDGKPRRRAQVTHVCADFETTPDRGPETMVFPCTEQGGLVSFRDLACLYGDHARDDGALRSLGIEVPHEG